MSALVIYHVVLLWLCLCWG